MILILDFDFLLKSFLKSTIRDLLIALREIEINVIELLESTTYVALSV